MKFTEIGLFKALTSTVMEALKMEYVRVQSNVMDVNVVHDYVEPTFIQFQQGTGDEGTLLIEGSGEDCMVVNIRIVSGDSSPKFELGKWMDEEGFILAPIDLVITEAMGEILWFKPFYNFLKEWNLAYVKVKRF